MLIVDGCVLYVFGFNFTWLDITKSRSFGIVTRNRTLVHEASRLFESDCARQTYTPGCNRFVVSPLNARDVLSAFVKGAKRQLLIYDPRVSDRAMVGLLEDRIKAGVDVRVIGRVERDRTSLRVEKYPGARMHVRAIIRDQTQAFLGSQSLRKPELERRREIGVIFDEKRIVHELASVFERDWAQTSSGKRDTSGPSPDASHPRL